MAYGAPAVPRLFSSSSSSSPSRGTAAGAAVSIASLLILLLASLPAGASRAEAAECGVVENVREVPLSGDPLADVFEHPIRVETVDELRVRLDDGRLVILVGDAAQRFRPGARVRLLHGHIFPT